VPLLSAAGIVRCNIFFVKHIESAALQAGGQ